MKKMTSLETRRIEIMSSVMIIFILFLTGFSSSAWNSDLSTNLTLYYNCDSSTESIGGIYNIVSNEGSMNYTSNGAFLGKSCRFTTNNNGKILNNSNTNFSNGNHSINFWGYVDDNITLEDYFISQNNNATDPMNIQVHNAGYYYFSGMNNTAYIGANALNRSWTMISLVHNGTGYALYINNTLRRTGTYTSGGTMGETFLGVNYGGSSDLNGYMDEIGFWNRSLNSTDINNLYNGGSGITLSITSVTLNSPVEAYNTTERALITFNCTVTDPTSLANVSLYINSVLNQTNSSGFNNTAYIFNTSLLYGAYTWTCGACGSTTQCVNGGNRALNVQKLIVNSEGYTTPTTSGNLEQFNINVSYDSSYYPNVIATFVYNGTNYVSSGGGNIFYKNLNVPNVSSSTNMTFYWNFELIHNSSIIDYINSTAHNQTINLIGLDNCSSFSTVVFNFTLKDEDNQTKINATLYNSSIKTAFNLYTFDRSTLLVSYSTWFNKTNPVTICFNGTIPTSVHYSLDGVVEYVANNYAHEYYNIQNYSLNNETANQNISLYDLISISSQPFRITYKDSSYLPVTDALITIQRYYTNEGIYKIVEVPKTDSYGETVGNLVLNDVIYTFTVSKLGQVLGVFQNMRVYCQTPSITECRIDLNSFSSSVPVTNFNTSNNFFYTIAHNRTTRTTTVTFVVLDSTPSLVTLNVTKEDAMGTSVCTDSVTSSAGTLTCTYVANIGNGTLIANIYKNGVLVGSGHLSLENTPNQMYGGIAVFLAIFVMMTLIGVGISDNPVYTTLLLLTGVLLLFALNLVAHNGFIGSTASILWLVIAVVLLVVKGDRRKI
jgi:hypothetical protein